MTVIHSRKTGHNIPFSSKSENLYSNFHPFLHQFGRFLLNEIDESGYMRASSRYAPYWPHWIRDSSFVAISLCNLSRFIKNEEESLAKSFLDAAGRVNSFNMNAINMRIGNIKNTIRLPYEDEKHYSIESHIPARIGRSMDLYRDDNLDDINGYNKWLIQHDTVPLFLMSLESEKAARGRFTSAQKQFLDSNSVTLGNYLNKISLTPSSNAWEMETNFMHPYTISAIYEGKRSLARMLLEENPRLFEKHWNGLIDNSAIIKMLRLHVKDGIAYRRREPWSGPDTHAGVDSEQIFMFSRFGISDHDLGHGVKERTLQMIEKDLFSGNILPIRNLNDVYFHGGRWILLGLEYARYQALSGYLGNAFDIINYVLYKYSSSMPEQEMVAPANPGSAEGKKDIERNGGMPIQHLNWSYASAIDAMISMINSARDYSMTCHGDSSWMDGLLRRE